jgi:hypothetical protein
MKKRENIALVEVDKTIRLFELFYSSLFIFCWDKFVAIPAVK